MIKIRLSRVGRKNLPFYHILATNSTSPRDSKFLERLGNYNPLLSKEDEKRAIIKKERAEYWLSVGAKPSDKVAKLLIDLGVKGAEKYKPKLKPKAKGSSLKKKAAEKLAKEKESQKELAAAV
jgi:small subunit ribosomal protein S16